MAYIKVEVLDGYSVDVVKQLRSCFSHITDQVVIEDDGIEELSQNLYKITYHSQPNAYINFYEIIQSTINARDYFNLKEMTLPNARIHKIAITLNNTTPKKTYSVNCHYASLLSHENNRDLLKTTCSKNIGNVMLICEQEDNLGDWYYTNDIETELSKEPQLFPAGEINPYNALAELLIDNLALREELQQPNVHELILEIDKEEAELLVVHLNMYSKKIPSEATRQNAAALTLQSFFRNHIKRKQSPLKNPALDTGHS